MNDTYNAGDPCLDLYFSWRRGEVLLTRRGRTSDGRPVNHRPFVLRLPAKPIELGKKLVEMLSGPFVLKATAAELERELRNQTQPALLELVAAVEGEEAFFDTGHRICVWKHGRDATWFGATVTPDLDLDREVLKGRVPPEELGLAVLGFWERVQARRWPARFGVPKS